MLKILHFDVETTGEDPHRHSIHQIAGGIEINGEIVDEFDFKVRPYPTDEVNAKSLAISGVTLHDIMNYEDGLSVMRKINHVIEKHIDTSRYTDKIFLSGYAAAHFDRLFLNRFFVQNACQKFKDYFWSVCLDTMVLSANALKYERGTMPDFSMESVAKRFNIDVDKTQLHNGAYDWKISRLLYHSLNKNN